MEAYATGVGTFTIKEVIDAMVAFIQTEDPGSTIWSIRKGATGTPHGDDWNTTFGQKGDPLIIGKTNGTSAEDLIVHIWEDDRRLLSFNLSEGAYDRAVGTDWTAEPNARYGTAVDAVDFRCFLTWAPMTTTVIQQYHFFMFNDYIWIVWKQQDGLWRNFGFGHIEKLSSYTGGAFVCTSHESFFGALAQSAQSYSNSMFVDMYGSFTSQDSNDYFHTPHFRCDTQSGDFRYGCGAYSFLYLAAVTAPMLGANDTAGSCGQMFNPYWADGNTLSTFEFDKMENTSTFGLTAPLIPVYFYIGREKLSYNWSLVGKLGDIFGMNIKSFSETSVIQIQGVDYMVFPRARKTDVENTLDGFPNSYHYGFVIRRPV